MAGLLPLVLLAIGLACSGVHASSYPTEVVELTDATFEHDTQAASGQTTGVWAVLFTDSTLKQHERAVMVVEELASDEDKELIYAQVDVARNVKLARRFGDTVLPPCLLLFRDRQMYLFDQPFSREDIRDQVREFGTSGFANTTPLTVPERHDRQINLEDLQKGAEMDMRVVFVSVLMIVGGLLFQTWAILNKNKFRPEPGTGQQQQQQGSQACQAAGKPQSRGAAAKGKAKAS